MYVCAFRYATGKKGKSLTSKIYRTATLGMAPGKGKRSSVAMEEYAEGKKAMKKGKAPKLTTSPQTLRRPSEDVPSIPELTSSRNSINRLSDEEPMGPGAALGNNNNYEEVSVRPFSFTCHSSLRVRNE